ncbi:MAG: exodeoxyribonuclease VII large subunit [Clostridiales bacterium]|nr:exodeoxyribonuclease VII large subunit [Clostridiales bacterium]
MAIKPITVSQINGYVKRVLQTDPLLGNVSVIGEISNLKYHSTGHIYFTLKDATSKLSCFLPASVAAHLRYRLAEGMEITAFGYVAVFERGGSYSLNIRDIAVEGTGNLAAAFQALKEKLEEEGLFDPQFKKPLPEFPKQIVIVTSPTGAAVRDIIKVVRQRNDLVNVIVYPVLVQGPGAAAEIAAAISHVNERFPETDVIITGRGGGSAEELWAFNEEIVARAVFLSEIPVISAVGHETDFSISDFAADKRAATPTEAAVLAVPDVFELRRKADRLRKDLLQTGLLQKLDLLGWQLSSCKEQLARSLEQALTQKEHRIQKLRAALDELSPYSVLGRGYGVVLDAAGKTLTSVAKAAPGAALTVVLKDGKLLCTADAVLPREDEGRKETK